MSEPRRRSPWPWILLAILVSFVLLLILGIAGIASLFTGMGGGETRRVVLHADPDPDGVFVEIPVEGVIVDAAVGGPNPVTWVNQCLKWAADEPNLKGILLRVNSPGGGIRASEVILEALAKFKAEHDDLPLVVQMEDVAASGGYYVSMCSDWIVAANETITASIGVIWGHLNWQSLMEEKIGVRFEPLKSAPLKDIGSPDRPMTEEEHALIQGFIDDAYDRFVTIVVAGRQGMGAKPVTAESVRALQSTILTGRRAFDHGLVDEIGHHEAAVAKLKQLAGIDAAEVVEYSPPRSVLDVILGAKTEAAGPLGLELTRLEHLYASGPALLALWAR